VKKEDENSIEIVNKYEEADIYGNWWRTYSI
jgi:hypothetical protein